MNEEESRSLQETLESLMLRQKLETARTDAVVSALSDVLKQIGLETANNQSFPDLIEEKTRYFLDLHLRTYADKDPAMANRLAEKMKVYFPDRKPSTPES